MARLIRSAFLALIVGLLAVGAYAQVGTNPDEGQRIHLDLDTASPVFFDAEGKPFPIPPSGPDSWWHELWPVRCVMHNQQDYSDRDGDGCLSVCDYINLDGWWYKIKWVGYTIFCSDGSYTLESVDIAAPDPTLNMWFEVSPQYGNLHRVKAWQRADGSPVPYTMEFAPAQLKMPKAGDRIVFGRGQNDADACHVDRVSIDIVVQHTGIVGGGSGG